MGGCVVCVRRGCAVCVLCVWGVCTLCVWGGGCTPCGVCGVYRPCVCGGGVHAVCVCGGRLCVCVYVCVGIV